MKNIFENAYFGKKYKTRDGRKAIYLGSFYNEKHFPHKIAVENCCTYGYPDDGTYIKERDYLDIVSEWEEPVDEEQLNKLADIASHKVVNDIYKNFGFQTAAQVVDYLNELYKAGYCKAMKDK